MSCLRSEWANDFFLCDTAAKAALRRKKVQEKNLEQTTAQIAQLEQQIYSIEAANINHETLQAMKQAGAAMAQIHGGMSIDKVDETMYVVYTLFYPFSTKSWLCLLTPPQGPTPGTTPAQRGDRPDYHSSPAWRAAGRGRAGAGTRGYGAGGYGRANAQDWSCAGQYAVGPVTGGWEVGV